MKFFQLCVLYQWAPFTRLPDTFHKKFLQWLFLEWYIYKWGFLKRVLLKRFFQPKVFQWGRLLLPLMTMLNFLRKRSSFWYPMANLFPFYPSLLTLPPPLPLMSLIWLLILPLYLLDIGHSTDRISRSVVRLFPSEVRKWFGTGLPPAEYCKHSYISRDHWKHTAK